MVHDLVQNIDEFLAINRTRGLLVKGPPGVGKSYSLINLTRYLFASGNHWDITIPDCGKWGDKDVFLKFLAEFSWG